MSFAILRMYMGWYVVIKLFVSQVVGIQKPSLRLPLLPSLPFTLFPPLHPLCSLHLFTSFALCSLYFPLPPLLPSLPLPSLHLIPCVVIKLIVVTGGGDPKTYFRIAFAFFDSFDLLLPLQPLLPLPLFSSLPSLLSLLLLPIHFLFGFAPFTPFIPCFVIKLFVVTGGGNPKT